MREQGSKAWAESEREKAKRPREKRGIVKGPKEGREEEDRKREQETRERKGERRGGDATVGKSRYVRVTSYARYTCVQGGDTCVYV